MATGATPTEESGYEYQFVETPPDRLVCKICLFPSRDPYLSVCCGHNFCKFCLDGVKKASTTVQYVCPMCRSEEDFKTVPNRGADREIRGLDVFCTNKERGCKWQGEVNNINNHLNGSCLFQVRQCPNECGKMFEQRYIADHIQRECPRRKVYCQFCGIVGEHQFIQQNHIEECPKVLLPCPNKCTVKGVPREAMQAHRKECPHEVVQCEYHNVGCKERMARKDYVMHIQTCMDKHLALTTQYVISIQQQHIENLSATISRSRKELSTTKNELEKGLEDTRSLSVDLHRKLTMQEEHLNILQGKLQEDVKGLTVYGNELQKKVEDNIEAELMSTKKELVSTKQELAIVKRELNDLKVAFTSTEGRLQAKTQTEVKQMKTYTDAQCQKVKAELNKDLSANKQRLNRLTQQYNDTKHELDELTKATKRFSATTAEERLDTLGTKLEAEINDVKMRLNAEQRQIRNDTQQLRNELAGSNHEIKHLQEMARKMNEQFNMEALQIGFQVEIAKLRGHVDQNYTPQKRVIDIEQQLGIIAGQYIHLPWTRELHSSSITGEEMCPVIIKVPKFQSKKHNEVKWCSHGFYTHNRGYKMCLRVIASGAGSGKNTHLSVFLYLMKGQYDSQLEWPLKGEFEMMLLNQIMDAEHHFNTVKFSEKTPSAIANKVRSGEMAADGLGRNEFILEKDLVIPTPTRQYLKDDCIFIKVSRKLV